MNTLNELVMLVVKGAKRVGGEVMIDKMYNVKCYQVGMVIRIDLIPTKNLYH